MLWSWYLANDMQFYIWAIVLLILAKRYEFEATRAAVIHTLAGGPSHLPFTHKIHVLSDNLIVSVYLLRLLHLILAEQACQGGGDNYRNIFVDIVDCIGGRIAQIQLFTESVRAAGVVWIFVRKTVDAPWTVCHGYVCLCVFHSGPKPKRHNIFLRKF